MWSLDPSLLSGVVISLLLVNHHLRCVSPDQTCLWPYLSLSGVFFIASVVEILLASLQVILRWLLYISCSFGVSLGGVELSISLLSHLPCKVITNFKYNLRR